jgi:alpha-mannosidase
MTTIHLIANAHLDPVWLWDWKEGLNEGITTCRTVLNLMDERPELTFIRGEAAIYEHIERFDPATFERIRGMVQAGRWDVVGGNYVQPDTNLTGEKTMRRHFARGRSYFASRFGQAPTIAWAADSFGHSAGLPDIMAEAGMTGYAFSRPATAQLKLPGMPFWWQGPSGGRVLTYRPYDGAYYSERDDIVTKLDGLLKAAGENGDEHIGCFYGIGNHGGGPTRRLQDDIEAWTAAHPEVKVVHSGLHRFFAALQAVAQREGEDFYPTFEGELNYCLRGCYASMAKFKFAFRRTEALVERTETVAEAIAAATDTAAPDLGKAWDALLFNSFHDILPGTSIERAFDQQLDWMGSAAHLCGEVELEALHILAQRVDTSVPPVEGDFPTAVPLLICNPNPHRFSGLVELEAGIDYRPIFSYAERPDDLPLELRGPDGALLPFQLIETEHNFLTFLPWRRRVLLPVGLAPLGWQVVTLGYVEGAEKTPITLPNLVSAPEPGVLDNGLYRIEAKVGAEAVLIFHEGREIFGGKGLSALTLDDPWGSWGGLSEEPESLLPLNIRHTWKIEQIETVESGPLRSRLWVQLTAGASRLELTFALSQGREAVDVAARVIWADRSARLKLVLPAGEQAEYEVPGAVVKRGPAGEVPGGRWVRLLGDDGQNCGFASNALYSFDALDGAVRPTIVRSTRYATDRRLDATTEPWRAATDMGELRFNFLLSPGGDELPQLARELEMPVLVNTVVPAPGEWPRSGSMTDI